MFIFNKTVSDPDQVNSIYLYSQGVALFCDEKGIRFESVTVPAAVMPDRFNDDGFMKYLPLSRVPGMGRLHKVGISQKTCHTSLIFTAFGKKSAGS
jgi:hypothetical protein